MIVRIGDILHVAALIRHEAGHVQRGLARNDLMRAVSEWLNLLQRAEGSCRTPAFPGTAAALAQAERLAYSTATNDEVSDRLNVAADLLEHECRDIWVEVIPSAKEPYFRSPGLGTDVEVAFPSAHPELVEADFCYVFERPTACVFHLMRAVEYAVRAFAACVGVSSPKIPLEYQQWEQLITSIEKAIDGAGIDRWPQPSRSNARGFFNGCIADMYAFRDGVRHVVMHTRAGGTYDGPGALSVRNRVADFFKRLHGRVDESGAISVLDHSRFL